MSTTNKEYIEFPEPRKASASPSLPWFVEYWASSIASKPIHELLLCGTDTTTTTACTSESSLQHTMDATVNDLSTYSSRLRQVVASHETTTDESDTSMGRYPTKGNVSAYSSTYPSAYPSIRKSSILYEEEDEEDEDDTLALYKQRESILDKSMFEVDEDNDEEDTRDGAPTTASTATTSSFMEDASSRMLYTCESFDNFLRGKSADESAVRLAPRLVEGDTALVTTRPINSAVRQRLQPPPSPSATTYTTVSLTTSYMRDMDDSMSDDDEGEDPKAVLERWTQASHQLFRGMEETERQDIYSTPKQSRKRPSSSPPPHYKRKMVSPHQDKHEAYQYLIRMKPQNYVHDYSNNGWEEEKKQDDYDDDAMFDLPSHLQLQSDMTFHEAFFQPPPSMPEF